MRGIINSFKQKTSGQKISFLFGLFFFLLYFALGLAFLYWKNLPFDISRPLQLAFGILLIVYSIFRLIRIIRQT